jgi:uncharacterized membrane protein YwaF
MIAVLVTVVWAAATYGFLNGKPHTASLLEVLGRLPQGLREARDL